MCTLLSVCTSKFLELYGNHTAPREIQSRRTGGSGFFPRTQRAEGDQRLQVCNVDTLTAALALGDASALNFANADFPGGGYLHGARAQEEDLCRLLPQLHPSLVAARTKGFYSIRSDACLVTRDVSAVRRPGSYELCPSLGTCTILTAAMPNGRPEAGSSAWHETVQVRVQSVLHAAALTGHRHLVLGAWGCGAFGNPPEAVAQHFREQLSLERFRGIWESVVFAIIDPKKDGNLRPFQDVLHSLS